MPATIMFGGNPDVQRLITDATVEDVTRGRRVHRIGGNEVETIFTVHNPATGITNHIVASIYSDAHDILTCQEIITKQWEKEGL